MNFLKDVVITKEDFISCGWKKIIDKAERDEYSTITYDFSAESKSFYENNQLKEAKICNLLFAASSMMLNPTSLVEPFSPISIMFGRRSALPEDFFPDDLIFFEEIAPIIDHPKLSARIYEILWLLITPRNPIFAEKAIENYCQIPVRPEEWFGDVEKCWERAIYLSRIMKNQEKLNFIVTTLINTIENSTISDGFFPLRVLSLLKKYRISNSNLMKCNEKISHLANQLKDEEQKDLAKDFYICISDNYRLLEDYENQSTYLLLVGDLYIDLARECEKLDPPNNVSAYINYENAIKYLRGIPKKFREKLGIENKLDEVRKLMNNSGELSLSEMGVISSGSIDISKFIEESVNAVRGKELLNALATLANIYSGPKVKELREYAEDMIKNHPLQAFVPFIGFSANGKVKSKRPGFDFDNENSEEVFWSEMVKKYMIEISLSVQGGIWPALEIVRQEHRISEMDFFQISGQSPIVPLGRENLISKALYLGFEGDFVSSIHIVTPQIENIVRYHLNQIGIPTTVLDGNGIETEIGLSKLMEIKEVGDIFGENLTFEFKALFCDPYGPNLRNEIAHGLLSYEYAQSEYSIYAWCLLLRMVVNSFWKIKNLISVDTKQPKN